jgi:hypothetical protein
VSQFQLRTAVSYFSCNTTNWASCNCNRSSEPYEVQIGNRSVCEMWPMLFDGMCATRSRLVVTLRVKTYSVTLNIIITHNKVHSSSESDSFETWCFCWSAARGGEGRGRRNEVTSRRTSSVSCSTIWTLRFEKVRSVYFIRLHYSLTNPVVISCFA